MAASDLTRFLKAQEGSHDTALAEIKNGRKTSHWIWYIFPQIYGLGTSQYAMFYGIRDLEEATDYLHEPLLGQRLIEISTAMLNLKTNDPYQVIGSQDDIKVKSCMTLFAGVREAPPIFQQVLD